MSEQVVTVTLAEAAAAEEAATEAQTDETFQPSAPLTAAPVAYDNAATYAKGALVVEAGQTYRSLEAGNKAHKPAEDTDFVHWAPVSVGGIVPLQNPAFGGTSYVSGG